MSNIAHILKGQKILFWSFLFRLGENFLEFYLLLIVLFFLNGKDKQKKNWQQCILPYYLFKIEVNSFELRINMVQVVLNGHQSHVRKEATSGFR